MYNFVTPNVIRLLTFPIASIFQVKVEVKVESPTDNYGTVAIGQARVESRSRFAPFTLSHTDCNTIIVEALAHGDGRVSPTSASAPQNGLYGMREIGCGKWKNDGKPPGANSAMLKCSDAVNRSI